jgi:hypothetical protein
MPANAAATARPAPTNSVRSTRIRRRRWRKDGGGVPLPGSDQFWVRKVNDHVRLVYRPLKDNPTNPYDYMILNAPSPGSTLWRMTDTVL